MRLVPVPLSPGDKISIIAPAGNIKPTRDLAACLNVIADMGFRVSCPVAGWPGEDYLADSDEARVKEFNNAWRDPEIKCIWTLRGGYGSLRLVDTVDFSLIENNPKYFIGFSDITILLNRIFMKTGLVTLHGPVVSSLQEADRETIARLASCLKEGLLSPLDYRANVLQPGSTAKGTLLGGNLCSLVSMLGTSCQPDFSGSVLFLEDINEPGYKIDRMLTQLFMSGALDEIKGIILGDFSDTDRNIPGDGKDPLHECARKRILEIVHPEIPVWSNLAAGHNRKNLALPVGAQVTMDNRTARLIFSD